MTDTDTLDAPGTSLALPPDHQAILAQMRQDAAMSFLPVPLPILREVAEFMAASGAMVPPAFQGQPDLCLAVAYQAARWTMDPVAVAQKAYPMPVFVKGALPGAPTVYRIGYEAQLITARINTAAPIERPMEYEFVGQGQQRSCRVLTRLRGGRVDSVYHSPTLAQIKVKNSPLWFSDPDQQLGYYSGRAWARRYCSEVILGIYTPDEIAQASGGADRLPAPDPYAPDAVVPATESSGGADAGKVKPDQGGPPDDDGGQRGGRPPRKPADDRQPLYDWAAIQLTEAKKLTDVGVLNDGLESMKATKNFANLKAKDQQAAQKLVLEIENHIARLAG